MSILWQLDPILPMYVLDICEYRETGHRGYKTFFMLNSAEHKNKSQIVNN